MKDNIYTSSEKGKLLFVGLVIFASAVIAITLFGTLICNF
jgi:hypothetical protein